MLEFEEVEIIAISPRNIVVSWSIVPTNEPVGQYRFDVYRSYDPESEFELEVEGLRNQFYWIDSKPAQLSKWQVTYYQVRSYQVDASGDPIPGTEAVSEPTALDKELNPLALHIIRNKQIAYRQLGIGRETLVYRRRNSGQKCSECWDPISRRVTRHDCPVCFGTGQLQGYYPPIKILVKYDPSRQENQVGGQLKEFNYTVGRMANYPPVQPRDIFYEMGTGRWWMVNRVEPTEAQRVLVSQTLELRQLDPQKKEQDLKLPKLDSSETIQALWLVEA